MIGVGIDGRCLSCGSRVESTAGCQNCNTVVIPAPIDPTEDLKTQLRDLAQAVRDYVRGNEEHDTMKSGTAYYRMIDLSNRVFDSIRT